MNRIREVRQAQNLSGGDLARLTGMDRARVSRIENGQRCCFRNARVIASALGVTVEDLWAPGTELHAVYRVGDGEVS